MSRNNLVGVCLYADRDGGVVYYQCDDFLLLRLFPRIYSLPHRLDSYLSLFSLLFFDLIFALLCFVLLYLNDFLLHFTYTPSAI